MTARRVHVIGASSGIGRATVLELAARGCQVVASARRLDRLKELEASQPGQVIAMGLDVESDDGPERGVRAAAQQMGGLDALVVTAGLPTLALLRDHSATMWRRIVAVNLVGPARAAVEAARLLPPGGRIVLLSSCSARSPWAKLAPYAAAKAGLESFAEGLQFEEPHLEVTTLVLGPTDTEAQSAWTDQEKRAAYRDWRASGRLPGPQQMSAERVAEVIVDVIESPLHVPRLDLMPSHAPVPGRDATGPERGQMRMEGARPREG